MTTELHPTPSVRSEVGAWAAFYAPEQLKTKIQSLLAELKQAERERDEALDTSPLRIANAEITRLHERLAKADKLAEALREYASADSADTDTWLGPRTARDALADWESE